MTRNGWWWLGALLSAVTALAGQADVFPEPWRHVVSTAGIVATTLTAANAHWPRNPTTRRRATDRPRADRRRHRA